MLNLLPRNIISEFFFGNFLHELIKLLQIIKIFQTISRKLRENILTLAAPKLAPEPVAAPGEKMKFFTHNQESLE